MKHRSVKLKVAPQYARCLVPNCVRVVKHRGLCGACYKIAWTLVIAGQCTWDELEAAGKSLPKRASGRPKVKTAQWFLNSAEPRLF